MVAAAWMTGTEVQVELLKNKENQYREEMFEALQEILAKRRQGKMIKELEKLVQYILPKSCLDTTV